MADLMQMSQAPFNFLGRSCKRTLGGCQSAETAAGIEPMSLDIRAMCGARALCSIEGDNRCEVGEFTDEWPTGPTRAPVWP